MTGRPSRSADAVVVAVALGAAYLLKRFYSQAGFDDLLWVLTPTTRLVELLCGASFELEPQRAYLSRELMFEIVPSCAGVNFLIVAWLSVCCAFIHTRQTIRGKLGHLLFSAVVAYLATLLANAARIWVAIQLHIHGVSLGPLTPDRLHRIEGVTVNFLFLLATLKGTDLLIAAGTRRAIPRSVLVTVPLCWYLGWSIGVPLANGAVARTGFAEHALTTLIVAVGLAGVVGKRRLDRERIGLR